MELAPYTLCIGRRYRIVDRAMLPPNSALTDLVASKFRWIVQETIPGGKFKPFKSRMDAWDYFLRVEQSGPYGPMKEVTE